MKKTINRNARRFFRENVVCRYHISPMSFNLFGSIPYTGFDYFPLVNIKKLTLLQEACIDNIRYIKDHKEIIENITQAFIESVMSFKTVTELLSLGKNLEELDELSKAKFKALSHGIPMINKIREKGNKTYNFFQKPRRKVDLLCAPA